MSVCGYIALTGNGLVPTDDLEKMHQEIIRIAGGVGGGSFSSISLLPYVL